VRQGVASGGSVDVILSASIGEDVLKLGVGGVDFPIAPPLHVAINGGTKEHLKIASFLLTSGADPTKYYIANGDTHTSYPPAFIYGLGYELPIFASKGGGSPTELVRRLYLTHPGNFNPSTTEKWMQELYPDQSLLHVTTKIGSFNGTYLLLTQFEKHEDINSKDSRGRTPIHEAASRGAWDIITILKDSFTDITQLERDKYGMTPLQLAAVNGHNLCIAALLLDKDIDPIALNRTLFLSDKYGRSALDLVMLPPVRLPTANIILQFAGGKDKRIEKVGVDLTDSEFEIFKTSLFYRIDQGSSFSTSNGWYYERQTNNFVSEVLTRRSAAHHLEEVPLNEDIQSRFERDYWSCSRPLLLVDNSTQYMKLPIWKQLYWTSFLQDNEHWPIKEETILLTSTFWDMKANENIKDRKTVRDQLNRFQQGAIKTLSVMTPVLDKYTLSLMSTLDPFKIDIYKNYRTRKRNFMMRFNLGTSFEEPIILPSVQIWKHRDYVATWNLVLIGMQEWYLFPEGYLDAVLESTKVLGTNVTILHWRRKYATQLIMDGILIHKILVPGDLLFIPRGWQYIMLPLSDSVSIHERV